MPERQEVRMFAPSDSRIETAAAEGSERPPPRRQQDDYRSHTPPPNDASHEPPETFLTALLRALGTWQT
jgi:hypothetical protein